MWRVVRRVVWPSRAARTLAPQEWVRECQDELMHESAVSAQLVASGGLQIVRAVCDASTGKLSIV